MISSFNIASQSKVLSARAVPKKHEWQSLEVQNELFSKGKNEFIPFYQTEEEVMAAQQFPPEQLEQIKQGSYQQGFLDGEKTGFEQGVQKTKIELQPNLKFVNSVVQALQQEKDSFYQENELYIVKLAIAITKKIILKELTQDPDILLYIVREALKRITDNGRIIIRANPTDIQLIKNQADVLENQLAVFSTVDFLPVEEIQRGGCIIESDSGIVDAQLDVQLEQIEHALLEGVQS